MAAFPASRGRRGEKRARVAGRGRAVAGGSASSTGCQTPGVRALLLRLLPTLVLGGVFTGPAGAQLELPPAYAEAFWSVEEGLPQDSVTSLCQDASGYMWIATFGGLARFDGVDFDTYYVGNRPDLPGSRFLSVAVDADGDLWTLVQRVGLLHYSNDVFRAVEFRGSDPVLFNDPNGGVWLRSRAGLGRIKDGEFEMVRAGEVRGAYVTADGTIWVTTVEDGLVAIESGSERVLGDVTATPGRPFVTLVVDHEGRLWGGNWRGLWRATDASNSAFERVDAAGDGIRQLELGLRGEVWIGSGEGLQRWHAKARTTASCTRTIAETCGAPGRAPVCASCVPAC
jgi:ligand-binding sensor domain-containing protein